MADLKSRLRQLDRLDAPDLWERATRIDPSPSSDADLATHRTQKRIVAGVVAAAVFIAAGAFAQQAFRTAPNGPLNTIPSSIDGTILWPERTEAALEATQAAIDAGDSSVQWRLDPREVATRFAEQVLGWGKPEGRYAVDVIHNLGPTGSPLVVTLDRYAIPCPSPAPGTVSYCPPPFQGERLELEQPATSGNAGAWSVTEVQASDIQLEVHRGDAVSEGSSIGGSITFPEQFSSADATPRVLGHAGIRIGTDDACFIEPTTDDADSDFSLDASIPSQSDDACGVAPASYVWAATEPYPDVMGYAPDPDPLYASTKEAYAGDTPFIVYALTAVPMTVSNYPSETAAPTAPSSIATPGPDTTDSPSFRLTSSALLPGGRLRCTATFPSDTIAPGEETDVRFVETNVSDGAITIDEGVNGDNGWLLVSSDGSQGVDSSLAHEGIEGPPPFQRNLEPGESARVYPWQVDIIWPGPLEVTPVCLGEPLPPLTLQVASTTPPVDTDTALSSALAWTGSAFSDCAPSAEGGWTVGTMQPPAGGGSFDVRCGAWVDERPGFDVVVLALVSPPDAPEIDLSLLPSRIEAVPYFDLPPSSGTSISWWVLVVTSDDAVVTHQYGIRQCSNSNAYGSQVATPCGASEG
jgi:hypothetical protein